MQWAMDHVRAVLARKEHVTCGGRMQGALREVQRCGYIRHQHKVALAERVRVPIPDVQKVFPRFFDHLRQMYLIV